MQDLEAKQKRAEAELAENASKLALSRNTSSELSARLVSQKQQLDATTARYQQQENALVSRAAEVHAAESKAKAATEEFTARAAQYEARAEECERREKAARAQLDAIAKTERQMQGRVEVLHQENKRLSEELSRYRARAEAHDKDEREAVRLKQRREENERVAETLRAKIGEVTGAAQEHKLVWEGNLRGGRR